MTLNEVIELLEVLRTEHGGDSKVLLRGLGFNAGEVNSIKPVVFLDKHDKTMIGHASKFTYAAYDEKLLDTGKLGILVS